jgi:hypothetical protein
MPRTEYAHLNLFQLGHVFSFQAGFEESVSQPQYHTVGRAKGDSAKGQRGHNRVPIAVKDVGKDANATAREGQEGEEFSASEFADGHGAGGREIGEDDDMSFTSEARGSRPFAFGKWKMLTPVCRRTQELQQQLQDLVE